MKTGLSAQARVPWQQIRHVNLDPVPAKPIRYKGLELPTSITEASKKLIYVNPPPKLDINLSWSILTANN
jgi:hypothetical protein